MAEPVFQVVERIFNQAIELPRKDRAAFLDQACDGHPGLRAAVEDLLSHDDETLSTKSFLVSPLADVADRFRPPPKIELKTDDWPKVAGYEILGELGKGGMGVVYKARQLNLNRIVALKMLLPSGMGGAEKFDRFQSEAELLARLNHPNIVPVYDVGEHEGRPYFTMEYIEGANLRDQLGGRPQDPIASAQLIETLARAIHVVHQQGIIHRDLKPSNILLATRGASQDGERPKSRSIVAPLAKITDFGLAKDQTSNQNLTQTGTAMGTPSYMAPEQARSRPGGTGPATDIYALGAILYEMLTGKPPFEAESPAETVMQLLNEPPKQPTQYVPRLPSDLVTICLKCLEKLPAQRYPSALDLAEDLHKFQLGEAIQARPISAVERFARWCRRRPLVAGLSALSTLLLLAFIVTVLIYNQKLKAALSLAEKLADDRKQQIVQLHVTIGDESLRSGDLPVALLRFAEALQLDQTDAGRAKDIRTKFADALSRMPQLTKCQCVDHPVLCVRQNGDELEWASLHPDNVIELRNENADRGSRDLKLNAKPRSASMSHDGRWLAVVNDAGGIQVWDRTTGKQMEWPGNTHGPAREARIQRHAPIMLTHHDNKALKLWRLTDAGPRSIDTANSPIEQIACSDDGRWILAMNGHAVSRWDSESGHQVAVPTEPIEIKCAAISADGQHAALVDANRMLRIWSFAKSEWTGKPEQLGHSIQLLTFNPTVTKLAMVADDHSVHVRSLGSNASMKVNCPCTNEVSHLAFSADGGRLLIADKNGHLRVCNTDDGQAVTPNLAHHGSLLFAAFVNEGRAIASVSKTGVVRRWDLTRKTDTSKLMAESKTADDLILVAQLYSGCRLTPEQKVAPLDAGQMRAAATQLRD